MKSAAVSAMRRILFFLTLLLLLNGSALAYSKLTLPSSLKEIGEEAFCGNASIEWVVIPEGTVSIGSRAFADCPSLWRVDIPASVSFIAEDAFEGSSLISLSTVKGSYASEFASANAFVSSTAGQTQEGRAGRSITYQFRDGVLTLTGRGAVPEHTAQTPVPWYYFRDRIKKIVIGDGITFVRRRSFIDCQNLEEVIVPESVQSIDSLALQGAPRDLVLYGVQGSAADRFAQRYGYTLRKTVDITAGPADSARLFDEEMLTLEVSATGDGLTYQWQCLYGGNWLNFRDGSYSNGASGTWGSQTPTYSCNTLTSSEEGWVIRCQVTDMYGNVAYTGGTTLSFRKPVEIVDQSPDVRCALGETAEFWVQAEGDGLTYQWYYRKGAMGEMKACLNGNSDTLEVVFEGDYELFYLCVVTDEFGNTTRSFMRNIYQEIELADPADASVKKGEYAVFSVDASGSDLTYQWQYRSPGYEAWSTCAIAGSTTDCILFKADTYHNGRQYRCCVKDADGVVQYSAPATLYVSTPVTGVSLSRSEFTLDMTASLSLTEWSRIDFSSGPVALTPLYENNLVAVVQPVNADNLSVVWSSSDPEIVSVVYDESGAAVSLQAGMKEGTAAVTVTTADGGYTASCEVTVSSTLAFEYLYIDRRSRKCGEALSCDFFFSGGVKPYSSQVCLYRIGGEGEANELVYSTSFAALEYSASYRPDRPGLYYYTAVLTDAAGVSVTAESDVVSVVRPVDGVTLNCDALTLNKGETGTLTAAVSPADASEQGIVWSVSDTGVVSCTNGQVTALSVGTATVTARSASDPVFYDVCIVTVRRPLERISLSESAVSLDAGQTFRLTPSFYPADATDQVISGWTSSASAVATVENGLVTARAAGTAVITAVTPEGLTASCTVNVGVPATGISLDQTSVQAYVDTDGYRLTASLYPAGSTERVVWSSSNPAVVTVTQDGAFRALRAGTAVVTASTESGAYSASCTVAVENEPCAFIYSNVDGLLAGESAVYSVYLENGFQPYEYKLAIRDNSDMSESAAYYWEDVYYHERKVSVNFDTPGEYTVILTMTDANGMTDVSAQSITVHGHVSLGEVVLPSSKYYTDSIYNFRAEAFGGLGPYMVLMSLYRTDDPYTPVATYSASDDGGVYSADIQMPGSGSYFVRVKAIDLLGEIAYRDSETFTVENIPVHSVTLNVKEVELRQGESFRVTAEVWPADATDCMVEVSYLDNVSILDFYPTDRADECEFFARESGECYVIFSSRSNPDVYATIHVTVFPQEDLGRITIINNYVPTPEEQDKHDQINADYETREQERREQGQDTEYTEIIITPGRYEPSKGENVINVQPRDYFPDVHPELAYSLSGYRYVCWPLGNSDVIPYTGKDLSTRGDVNGPRSAAVIYATDQLYIKGVGLTDGINWALVTYPTGSGSKDAYISLWDVIGGVEQETREMTSSFTLTKKRGGGGTAAYVREGQYAYLLYRDTQACQVMLYEGNGVYSIGWCTPAEYEGAGSNTVTPGARDYFPDVNGALGGVYAGDRFVCYPLGSSNIIPYTDKTLDTRGNIGAPRASASIYAADELILLDLGLTSGVNWARVSYPTGSGPKEAYIDLWDVIDGVEKEARAAAVTFNLSQKRGGAKTDRRAVKGETIYLLYRDSQYCQIIARQSNGDYFIGWCTANEYDGVAPDVSLSGARLNKGSYQRGEQVVITGIQVKNACSVKIESEYLAPVVLNVSEKRSWATLPDVTLTVSSGAFRGMFPVSITAYDSAGGVSEVKTSLSIAINAPEKPKAGVTGYAEYTGIDYTAELRRLLNSGAISQKEYENRITLLNRARDLSTVKWVSPVTFHTWRADTLLYNSNSAMVYEGSPGDYIHFWAGVEYVGIPYCAHGSHNDYDIERWDKKVSSAAQTSDLEGTTYYESVYRPDCTFYGIDCSGYVADAYQAFNGAFPRDSTKNWMNASYLSVTDSPIPGDMLLKSGHVMIYVGMASNGKPAVLESTAEGEEGASGCRYFENYSSGKLQKYKYMRYAGIDK